MLNDLFITRDASAHLIRYLDARELALPEFRRRLEVKTQKQLLSYELWWRLLEELQTLHPIRGLGIDIGRSISVEHCGVIGYLFRTSENVLEALACYQRFESLLYAGSQVQSRLENAGGTLVLEWPVDQGLSSQHSDALLLAALVNIIREILDDPSIHPCSVGFTHAVASEEHESYLNYFQCPVRYQQAQLSIHFTLSDLQKPIPYHDRNLHQLLGAQAQDMVKQLPDADVFLSRAREAMIRGLKDGKADAVSVAQRLNVSTRGLHRKLQAKDKLFRDLLRETRMQLSKEYLSNASLSLAEIALLLAYSEQSAFNRAFKEWYGMSPKQFRQKLK